MTNLSFPFRMVQILGVAAFLAMGFSPLPAADASAVTAQLASISTLEGKLAFLQKNTVGLSNKDKAALGASVIQSIAPADQKKAALQIAQTLSTGNTDVAKFASLLVDALPSNLAGTLAGSIAIGAGQADPAHLPQITAAVIVANSTTISNAPAIAAEVTASAPLSRASAIASAIGSTFSAYHSLAKEAPQIAASMTSVIVTKGTIPEVRPEVAATVAALTALLPGTVNANRALITEIGKEVAAVIAVKYPGLATTIVGVTSAALKASAGDSNIELTLNKFSAEFRDVINDPIIQGKLDAVVDAVNKGSGGKDIQPFEQDISNAHPSSTPQLPQSSPTPLPVPTPTPTPGPINPPETPVTNV